MPKGQESLLCKLPPGVKTTLLSENFWNLDFLNSGWYLKIYEPYPSHKLVTHCTIHERNLSVKAVTAVTWKFINRTLVTVPERNLAVKVPVTLCQTLLSENFWNLDFLNSGWCLKIYEPYPSHKLVTHCTWKELICESSYCSYLKIYKPYPSHCTWKELSCESTGNFLSDFVTS